MSGTNTLGVFKARLVPILEIISNLNQRQLHDASKQPPFSDIVQLCAEFFPALVGTIRSGTPDLESARFSLVNFFDAVGIPRGWEEADRFIDALVASFSQRHGEVIHLCPLDLADDLPNIQFGLCEIRTFNSKELSDLMQYERLKRRFPALQTDIAQLSYFNWLLVREPVTFAPTLSHRGGFGSLWDFDLNQDFGAIKPFSTTWPKVVDDAVYALILQNWEDYAQHRNYNWRAFQIPWVYTVTPDRLAAPAFPPSHETLSWQTQIGQDGVGQDVEMEVPLRLNAFEDYNPIANELTESRWQEIVSATSAPIFNPTAAHFMVRAFRNTGIDEFLSHISAVEAAVGLGSDFGIGGRPPRIPGKQQGATARLRRRIAGLLGDIAAGARFEELFSVRSAYLHGRLEGSIASRDRVDARIIARRVVNVLVDASIASANATLSRESFLSLICP